MPGVTSLPWPLAPSARMIARIPIPGKAAWLAFCIESNATPLEHAIKAQEGQIEQPGNGACSPFAAAERAETGKRPCLFEGRRLQSSRHG